MGLIHILLNTPIRRRIRILQASIELLTNRIADLEEAILAATFPDHATRLRLSESIGQSVTIYTELSTLQGILVFVNPDSFEMRDGLNRLVIIPAMLILRIEIVPNSSS